MLDKQCGFPTIRRTQAPVLYTFAKDIREKVALQ